MGVEMYLGQSDQQAGTASSVLSNRISAYETIRSSLQSFIGTNNLQGHTYRSAKDYSSQVLIPLLKGCILLDEAIKEACAKLPSEYRSQVDTIDLREDELLDKIQQAGLMASRYEYLASLERQKEKPNWTRVSDLSLTASRYMEIERRLQEKLRKLLAFNSSSAHLFEKIHPLLETVNAGLKQVRSAWNPSTKAFEVSSLELSWVITIQEKWERYDFEDGLSDFAKGITNASDWSKEAVGSFFEKTADKVFKEGKNIGKSWAAKLQPRSSIGTFIKDSLKPRKWLTGKLKGTSSTVSKIIGNTAKWGGRGLVIFGAYQEAKEHYNEHRNIGRAISYSAVATGVGYVAGTIGASIGGAVAVGLGAASTGLIATFAAPLVGAVVVGALASVAVTALYSNVKPFRKAVDWVGDKINDIGRVFSNSLGKTKGVFSW